MDKTAGEFKPFFFFFPFVIEGFKEAKNLNRSSHR
jgi:hypothetical protein